MYSSYRASKVLHRLLRRQQWQRMLHNLGEQALPDQDCKEKLHATGLGNAFHCLGLALLCALNAF